MGTNAISWKRVQRLNEQLGERFVHCTTQSHHEWWWWHCIRHDGSSVYYNTRTGEIEEATDAQTTTVSLLKSREAVPPGENEWLDTLNERARSLHSEEPS